jgi:hypothetical protein
LQQVNTAAWRRRGAGLADTLAALQQDGSTAFWRRVIPPAGVPVSQLGAVIIEAAEACPYCGGALAPSADGNLAVRARHGAAGVHRGSSPEMAALGNVAAVLRY